MKTFKQALSERGLDKRNYPRHTINNTDRPKGFPTDKDAPVYAAHPEGEIAGYIEMFCKTNKLIH